MRLVTLMLLMVALLLVLIFSIAFFVFVPMENRVCVIDPETNDCMLDITKEFNNIESDSSRECGARDRYYNHSRYICVREIMATSHPVYLERGADSELTTYFTEIDGNTYIFNSMDLPDIQPGHLYYSVALTQAGYCHGPSKLIEVQELNVSCDGRSRCHGIPMGFPGNESMIEQCGSRYSV